MLQQRSYVQTTPDREASTPAAVRESTQGAASDGEEEATASGFALEPELLACAAAVPHVHVMGRERVPFVVITVRAQQTDHFPISDGYMTTNRKLDVLQLGRLRLHFPEKPVCVCSAVGGAQPAAKV